jgi:hypothetical protein
MLKFVHSLKEHTYKMNKRFNAKKQNLMAAKFKMAAKTEFTCKLPKFYRIPFPQKFKVAPISLMSCFFILFMSFHVYQEFQNAKIFANS